MKNIHDYELVGRGEILNWSLNCQNKGWYIYKKELIIEIKIEIEICILKLG